MWNENKKNAAFKPEFKIFIGFFLAKNMETKSALRLFDKQRNLPPESLSVGGGKGTEWIEMANSISCWCAARSVQSSFASLKISFPSGSASINISRPEISRLVNQVECILPREPKVPLMDASKATFIPLYPFRFGCWTTFKRRWQHFGFATQKSKFRLRNADAKSIFVLSFFMWNVWFIHLYVFTRSIDEGLMWTKHISCAPCVALLRYMEEVIESTFSLLSSNSDHCSLRAEKILQPVHLLALLDIKATWFNKWMVRCSLHALISSHLLLSFISLFRFFPCLLCSAWILQQDRGSQTPREKVQVSGERLSGRSIRPPSLFVLGTSRQLGSQNRWKSPIAECLESCTP